MERRRATIARLTTKTILALCLFVAATTGIFLTGSSSARAAPFAFLTNHQLYDRGADIRSLQEFFNTHGFLIAQSGPGSSGNETSFFGLATFQALKDFQAAHGLPSTGYFGPLTRAAINSGDVASSTAVQTTTPATTIPTGAIFTHALNEGQRGADVTELQQILIKQGFLGAGDDTGYFGPLTAKAVAAFQAAHNLDPLGGVGPLTRALLNSLLPTVASSQSTPTVSSAPATTTASTSTTTPNSKALPGYQPGQIIFGGGGSSGGGGGGGGGGSATPAADTTAPTAPTNLSATVTSSSQVNLSWSASTDNVAVTGYDVYRDGTLVGTASTNNYNDTGLAPSTLHSYWVSAYDAASNISAVSGTAVAVTQAGPDAYGTTWKPLAIGAGGYVDGIDIAPDGTMVARTDTNGAYLWTGTQWKQLITATNMPTNIVQLNNGGGAYEIRIAPSNTSTLYMNYLGYIFKSTNRGATWTQTAFSPVSANANDSYRMNGQKIAVDPANPNVVYAGTPSSGIFVTTNGGTSWSQIATSSIGASTTPAVGYSIVFDPSSSVVGSKTQGIYIASYGIGVYHSTDGGSTWTLTSGGPTQVGYLAIATSSALFAVENGSSNLWRYSGGTWSELFNNASFGIQAVAVDPFNANHVVYIGQSGRVNQSFDGGNTWSGQFPATAVNSSDIPWLSTTGTWMTAGGTAFDPQVQGKMWLSYGSGAAYLTLPAQGVSPGTVTWNDQSLGIDQLVANEIISPPGGQPVVTNDDFGDFYVANPDVFPSTHGPVSGTFAAGWSLDYASNNPGVIVALTNWGFGATELSGESTDGGQTWTQFASKPTDVTASGKQGGSIAAASSTNIVWIPSDGDQPYYTTNGGSTWTAVDPPGTTATDNGWGFAYYLTRQIVAADRVNIGTFYAYHTPNGLYRSTDGGASWSLVHSGEITSNSGFNAKLRSVPGIAGDLFFTGGPQSGSTLTSPANESFEHSTDGGATWTAVPNVEEVIDFGFGKAKAGTTTPAIYMVGWVNSQYGIYESDDGAQTWTQIGLWPLGSLETVSAISGDMNAYGRVYLGLSGGGYVYGNTTNAAIPPILSSISSGTPVSTSATITWTTDKAATSNVVYGTTSAYGSATSSASLITSHSILLTGLSAGTTYHYAVVSADAQGNTATSSDHTFMTFDTTPPSASTNFIATASSSREIDLSWTASNDNGGGDSVVGYQIFRSGTQIATTSATTYADIGLNGSTTFAYIVKSYDQSGNVSASSTTATATTTASAGGANSLAIDGSVHANTGNATTTTTTLTTTFPNDVIILYALPNSSPITSVSDSASLTWTKRATGAGGGEMEEWYAIATTTLSSDVVTVSQSSSNFFSIDVFGVSGAYTASPFDGTAVTGGTDPVSISTTHANAMIIGSSRAGQPTCAAGPAYTLINGNDYSLAEYLIASTTQSNLSINLATACAGQSNAMIGDAVIR